MERRLYRLWCQKCQDWTLFSHVHPNKEDFFCEDCETMHVKTELKDIPEDQLLAQRKRYNANRVETYKRMYEEMMMPAEGRQIREFVEMFREPGWETEIIEADAGQKKIDEAAQMERQREIEKAEERKREVIKECIPYKNMTRNDQCACGSGKKYKKCCMDKIEGYLLKYNLSFKSYK